MIAEGMERQKRREELEAIHEARGGEAWSRPAFNHA
jgi:hypothetical protein